MIKLAFLGTGTCTSTTRNPQSFVLSNGNESVLIDAGGGCYHQLARLIEKDVFFSKRISAIIFTHYHMDHISGLPDIFWGEVYGRMEPRSESITLIGPPGLFDFYKKQFLSFYNDDIPFHVELIELKDTEQYDYTFFNLQSFQLYHNENSTGYFLTVQNNKIAITGDTGICENLMSLLQFADIAIVEWSEAGAKTYDKHIFTEDIIELLKNNLFPKVTFFVHLYLRNTSFEQQISEYKKQLKLGESTFYFAQDLDIYEMD